MLGPGDEEAVPRHEKDEAGLTVPFGTEKSRVIRRMPPGALATPRVFPLLRQKAGRQNRRATGGTIRQAVANQLCRAPSPRRRGRRRQERCANSGTWLHGTSPGRGLCVYSAQLPAPVVGGVAGKSAVRTLAPGCMGRPRDGDFAFTLHSSQPPSSGAAQAKALCKQWHLAAWDVPGMGT